MQSCDAVLSDYIAYIYFNDAVVEFYQQLGFEAEPEGIRYGVVFQMLCCTATHRCSIDPNMSGGTDLLRTYLMPAG